eukprot:1160337-Pelagomonas_calceolata.AAC.5
MRAGATGCFGCGSTAHVYCSVDAVAQGACTMRLGATGNTFMAQTPVYTAQWMLRLKGPANFAQVPRIGMQEPTVALTKNAVPPDVNGCKSCTEALSEDVREGEGGGWDCAGWEGDGGGSLKSGSSGASLPARRSST